MTLEKPPSDTDTEADRRVLDVNTLAIFFVEDHPGHRYVSPIVEDGLAGRYVPLILDILPLRAYWVMTVKWGCSKDESVDAIAPRLNCQCKLPLTIQQKQRISAYLPPGNMEAFHSRHADPRISSHPDSDDRYLGCVRSHLTAQAQPTHESHLSSRVGNRQLNHKYAYPETLTLFSGVSAGLGSKSLGAVTLLAAILLWLVLVNMNSALAIITSISPPSPIANQPFTISGTSGGNPLVVFSGSGCHGSPIFSTPLLPSGAPYSFTVPGQPAGQYSATDFTGANCVNFTVSPATDA